MRFFASACRAWLSAASRCIAPYSRIRSSSHIGDPLCSPRFPYSAPNLGCGSRAAALCSGSSAAATAAVQRGKGCQTRLRPRLQRTGDEEGPARRHSVRGRVCVRARLMHRLAVDCPQQRSRSESAQQPQPKLSRPWQFTEDGVALFQVGVGGLASLVERELHPGRRRHRLPPRLDLLRKQPLP